MGMPLTKNKRPFISILRKPVWDDNISKLRPPLFRAITVVYNFGVSAVHFCGLFTLKFMSTVISSPGFNAGITFLAETLGTGIDPLYKVIASSSAFVAVLP